MKRIIKELLPWLVPLGVALTIFVIFSQILFLGYVPTSSMEPTLMKDSLIVGTRIYSELKLGDIVIFEHDGQYLVKRIAAVGGDMVERNGEVLTVSENCFYMLGDNAEDSIDSRYWEEPFVEEEKVVAMAIM